MSYTNRNFGWDFDSLKRFYDRYVVKWLNSSESWTSAQKKQARVNLGFGSGDIDDKPTAGSDNPVKSGGVQNELALGAVYDVSAKNPTAGSNNDGKWESLSALLSDTNLNTLIPTSVRKGGMSIKFVRTYDNKYVQYRLTKKEFSIDAGDWVGEEIAEGVSNSDFAISDENDFDIVAFKNGHIKTKNFDSKAIKIQNLSNDLQFYINSKHIKVLILGNSWSYDAYSYVPALLKEMLPKCYITIGILYQGGATLEDHYNNLANSVAYTFNIWTNDTGKWVASSKSFIGALGYLDWDICVFQQQSSKARDYNTYQPYLNNLIKFVIDNADYPIKFGFNLTPPLPANSPNLVYEGVTDTPITMFEKIVNSVKQAFDETLIETIFPFGTAIADAMTNATLDALGDGGHLFYSDHQHLQEGIPCLLEAYVVVNKLLELYGYDYKSFVSSDIIPDSTFVNAQNIPGQHGSPTGVNADNIYLAKKVSLISIKNNYEIVNCNNI